MSDATRAPTPLSVSCSTVTWRWLSSTRARLTPTGAMSRSTSGLCSEARRWGNWTRTSWTPFTPSCDVAAIIAQAAMRLFIAPGSHTAVTNAASLIPAGHFQRLLSDRSTSFSAVRCVVQSAGSGSRRTRWPRPTRPRHPSRVRSHRPPRRQPASSARRGKTRILVWLTMVTGLRRGELCAIKWRHVNLPNGVLSLERSVSQRGSRTWERERERETPRPTSNAGSLWTTRPFGYWWSTGRAAKRVPLRSALNSANTPSCSRWLPMDLPICGPTL
jgi:hypothetical protein